MTMSDIDLLMRFKFGLCNGPMTMKIYQDEKILGEFSNIQEESVIFKSTISMSSDLIILLTNKFPQDTIIKNENIIADKFIQLKEMRLGRIPIQEYILFDICKFETNNENLTNTYWGFNGKVNISLSQDNFIKWHLNINNKFEL